MEFGMMLSNQPTEWSTGMLTVSNGCPVG